MERDEHEMFENLEDLTRTREKALRLAEGWYIINTEDPSRTFRGGLMRSWTDLTVIYMRITCLVEDRARPPLRGEHGLSLHIEGDVNILFDTGQSGLLMENAELLGVDLGDVDLAILSHGHYDHGGGLTHFMEINENAEVLTGEGAFRGDGLLRTVLRGS